MPQFTFDCNKSTHTHTHLSTTAPTPVLASLLKAPVKVNTDWPFVEQGTIDILDRIFSIGTRVVNDKAKAAWCVLLLVKAHDDAFDVASSGEDLCDG